MGQADAADRALRWAPGIGATVVGMVALLIAGLIVFDLSLDRVSVEGLADDGQVDRPTGDGAVDGSDDDADDDDAEEVDDTPRRLGSILHVLIAGSDDRSVLTREERRDLSTGDAAGERTEALALVRIDPDSDRVDVLRFPRDLLVTRCDGSRGRINAAYAIGENEGIGGATCLVETVTAWTGIPIHHVVKIHFRGFVDAVDAVGGVEMAFDEELRDRRAGLDLPAGCVELDGADALAFVRARHLDDDFGRIERQQQLIAATMDQVLTSATLGDPRRLGQLMTTAQRSLQVDDRMTPHRMRAIAATVARLGGEDLVTRTVHGDLERSDRGVAFLHPDDAYAEELFDAFVVGDLPNTPGDAGAAARSREGANEGSGDGHEMSATIDEGDDADADHRERGDADPDGDVADADRDDADADRDDGDADRDGADASAGC